MNSDDLLKRLQPHMRKSDVYRAIFNADVEQLNARNERVVDLQRQLSVGTATWGLSIYEQEYGLQTNTGRTNEERRSTIIARMRGHGEVNAEMIRNVSLAFTGGAVQVGFDRETSTVIIEFVVLGTPPNLADFYRAIEDIKPAFLQVRYDLAYPSAIGLSQSVKGQLITWNYRSGTTWALGQKPFAELGQEEDYT